MTNREIFAFVSRLSGHRSARRACDYDDAARVVEPGYALVDLEAAPGSDGAAHEYRLEGVEGERPGRYVLDWRARTAAQRASRLRGRRARTASPRCARFRARGEGHVSEGQVHDSGQPIPTPDLTGATSWEAMLREAASRRLRG